MIYLVSGFSRSGTSMMMQCLVAGGLIAADDHLFDELNRIYGDEIYQPNPNGFFMLAEDGEFRRADFVEEYDGRLIKIQYESILSLPPHSYRMVFMLRNPQEIYKSMLRFMPEGFGTQETATFFYDEVVGELLMRIAKRVDIDICTVYYHEVVRQPLKFFSGLGWPIDVARSSACVDPALYRMVV